MVTDRKIKQLVIDSGAFVRNVPLWEFGEEFFCTREVINEIKDKQTKQFIAALPIQLVFKEPSAASVKFINDFTKKTGDFASLSLADVKVLALAYQLEVEANGNSHLRSEPVKQRVQQIASVKPPESNVSNAIEGFYMPSCKSRNSITENSSSLQSNTIDVNNTDEDDDEEEDDDDEDDIVEEEFNYVICASDIDKLNAHLCYFAYVKGYLITSEDVYLYSQLLNQFPLFRKLSVLSKQHLISGHLKLFQRICQNYKGEFSKADSNGGYFTLQEESESTKFAREFYENYCQMPNFMRWFCHMLTYTDVELRNIRNTYDIDVSLKNILDNLKEERTSNETTEEITNELKTLNIDPEHHVESDNLLNIESSNVIETLEEQHRTESSESGNSTENDENDSCSFEDDEDNDECDDDEESDEDDDDDDDESGWITPSNIKAMKTAKHSNNEELPANVVVACITGDFSMQNTLKHIGLHVVGINGKLIKTIRTYILRCHACFKTTNKMEKIFCPHCGNKTLKKVNVTLNPDGTQRIWINMKRPINIRGTKYSLPRPKGGKHSFNPILVADQREAQVRATRLGRLKNDPLHEDYDARAIISPFTTRDVYSRSAQLGIKSGKTKHRGIFYWEQKNPNVSMKKGSTKKRK